MKKAVVVFVKEENQVNRLISSGIVVSGDFITVLPLVAPTIKVTVSNVPPFIQNQEIERELLRYGKLASAIKTVPLRRKHEALKHVMSFRRHVFMFLKAGTHQADGWPSGNVGPMASDGRASLFVVFHSSALVGLTSVAVCQIQHVESASWTSGPSARERTLIGCSV